MFNRGRHNQLQQEIEAHIAAETQLNLDRGMAPGEARLAALRRFGNVSHSLEDSRAIWVPALLDQLAQDLSYGLRSLWRNPVFALSAAAVVAISIGFAVPVFSFLDSVFLRPSPYFHSERLVSVGIKAPVLDYDFLFANDYLYLRESQSPFTQLTSWTGEPACDLTQDSPVRFTCAQVESTFLPTLGVKPLLGRNFTAVEDRPDAGNVALITYPLWQSLFAASPNVLGKTLSIDGSAVMVIGVLPRDFEFPSRNRIDLLVPQRLGITQYVPHQSGRALHAIGRLKHGTSVAQASAQLQPFFRFQLLGVPPPFRKDVRPSLISMREAQLGPLSKAGWLLAGGTAAILLIQIANLASLLLARGIGRAREFNIRSSLGAGRARIMRQVATESIVLSLAGGFAGCLLAVLLIRVIRSLAPASIPHSDEITINVHALLFFVTATLATGLIAGIIGGARAVGVVNLSLQRRLVAFQIAISLMLVTIAGMLIQSFQHLQSLSYGVQTDHVLIADVSLGFKRYPNTATRQHTLNLMLSRLRATPGVTAVAFSDTIPPSGFVHDRPLANFVANGLPVRTEGAGGEVAWRSITPHYFQALGIQILRGRGYTDADRTASEDTLIISAALAYRLFGGNAAAIGAHLRTGPESPDYTVIGVTADVRNHGSASEQLPEYYVLRKDIKDQEQGSDHDIMTRSQHRYDGEGSMIVRTAGRPDLAARAIREELHQLDATVPITESTLDSRLGQLLQAPRFRMLLVSAFAAVALLLALFGIYGTMSYLVLQRAREIGIRMAIGATRQRVLAFVMRRALRWTISGLLAGLCLSFSAARWAQSLFFQVSGQDPVVFFAAAAFVLAAALLATLLPSLRATRIDPLKVIRQD